ncbi:MAG: pseudoazurin [Rickettsiales bacterium]
MKLLFTFITIFLLNIDLVNAKTFSVQILNKKKYENMIFDPNFLKIELGDEVEFIPTDKGHNSQALLVPKGAEKWQGKVDEKITVKFTKKGLYFYECKYHGVMGMFGLIQVGNDLHNKNELLEFTDNYRKKLIMNKNRIDGILMNLAK